MSDALKPAQEVVGEVAPPALEIYVLTVRLNLQ
jgi:hypothetical protein